MKNIIFKSVCSLLVLSPFAIAQSDSSEHTKHYFGAEVASVSVDSEGWNADTKNLNILYGYNFNNYLAGELFGSFNFSPQEDKTFRGVTDNTVNFYSEYYSMYLVGKTPGDFYGKAKIGLANSMVVYTSKGYEDEKKSATGLSYGVGAGYRHNNVSVEANYIVFPEVDDPLFSNTTYESIMMSFGVSYHM